MQKLLGKLLALTSEEWYLLLSSVVLLPSVAVLLKFRGFEGTKGFLSRFVPEKIKRLVCKDKRLEEARKVARMVSVAAYNGPYRANCLKRALVLWWLLARRGMAADIKIGVNKDDGTLRVHAWVEYEDAILLDTEDGVERFSTFEAK